MENCRIKGLTTILKWSRIRVEYLFKAQDPQLGKDIVCTAVKAVDNVSGVGFRVLPRDVDKLPKIRTDIEVIHKYYEPVAKDQRREYTDFDFDEDDVVTINVGDSKEGWIQSLEYYFKFLVNHAYRPLKRIIFNYDSVRPKGEKLKTFGGTASGHQSLKRMFTKIDKLLKEKPARALDQIKRVKLKPIDAMDVANIIAENVVSGGVRRSSQICLFSQEDKEIAQAKNNLYVKENNEWIINKEISHRQMSNNSIFMKPSLLKSSCSGM